MQERFGFCAADFCRGRFVRAEKIDQFSAIFFIRYGLVKRGDNDCVAAMRGPRNVDAVAEAADVPLPGLETRVPIETFRAQG